MNRVQNISLRKAEIGDIEIIKSILFAALKEYRIAIEGDYPVDDIDMIGVDSNGDQAVVLVKDDSVIGFLLLRLGHAERIELKRMYLARSERGQGLGEVLLNYAITFAIDNNYKCIGLETASKFREAVSLYKKHGFRVKPEFEKAPGHDLALEKRL